MTLLRPLLVGILAIVLSGCTTSADGLLNVSGIWAGTVTNPETSASMTLRLQLAETAGSISGTARLAGFMTAEVSGSRSGRNASMNVYGEFLDPGIVLSGVLTASTFTGTWSVSGGAGSPVSLERQ